MKGGVIITSVGLLAVSLFANVEVVDNVHDLKSLLVGQQQFLLPIAPPSEGVFTQPYGPVLPVDWDGFPDSFKKQMYAQMDGNGYPIYRVYVYEDPVTRQTVFLNSYGTEVHWLEPAADYDPYAWIKYTFDVEDETSLDEFRRWIYDPAHIAAEFRLIPELFHDSYQAALQEQAVLAASMAPMGMTVSMSSAPSNLVMTISGTSNSTVELGIHWPTNFTDTLEILATTNLMAGGWELARTNIPTSGTNNYFWIDPVSSNLARRSYRAGNADLDSDLDSLPDARESYIYGTDPATGDTDADGLGDGEEVYGNGTFGDTDDYLTNPFRPDRVDYLLPAPPARGPAASLAGFALFDPPTTNSIPPTNAPAISEWMRIADCGETVTLAAENLSVHTNANGGMDMRFLAFGQSGAGKVLADAHILRREERLAAIRLPEALPPGSMYLLWPRNANGYGEPVAVNQVEAWWIGPDRVATGENFSVFGRNLSLGGEPCRLYFEEADLWLSSTDATPYKADFVLPTGLANGTHTLWAHNGSGREHGWSDPLELTVQDPIVWDEDTNNWIDVTQPPYNATGNGVSNDYVAIVDALFDCPDYGTVYFPTGTYLIGDRIGNIDLYKRLLGDGSTNTVITTDQTVFDNSDHGMIHDTLYQVEIRGIGFEPGTNYLGKIIRCRGSDNVAFVDCRFSQLHSPAEKDLVDVSAEESNGSENILFERCEFLANHNVYCAKAKQVLFRDCDFLGLRDVNSLLNISGAWNVSVIGCTAGPYDDSDPIDGSGWTKGRFMTGSGNSGPMRNFHIAGNTTTNMCPRYDPAFGKYNQPVDQNSGEQILFEWLTTRYRGAVLSAASNTVQCAALTNDLSGQVLVVVAGRGFGQARRVEAVDAGTGTATLDAAWRVGPDAGSRVQVGSYVSRSVVCGNRFDGHERAADPDGILRPDDSAYTNYTASCGVSFYGGTVEAVVAGNRISEVRKGIANRSLAHDSAGLGTPVTQPSYFNLFEGNAVNHALKGIREVFQGFEGAPTQDVAMAGNVWRGNTATGITGYGIETDANHGSAHVRMNLYANNRFEVGLQGVAGLVNALDPVLYGNTFSGDGGGTGIVFPTNHVPVLRENIWSSFATNYGGAVPGGVLETPLRAVELSDTLTNAVLDVWNSGTSNLAWSASTTCSWITVTGGSGAVDDERDGDLLAFHIDPAAIPAGISNGMVEVVGNGQTNLIGVWYE